MTAITILGNLWEILKGLVTIIPKISMFNSSNTNTTNYNYNVEKGGTLNQFVITDTAVAKELMANAIRRKPETESTEPEQPINE